MEKLNIVASNRVKDNTAFMSFLRRLPKTFNHEGTEIHTARNRLRIMDVGHLGIDGLDRVMVKRYHGLFWFQKIDYTFIRQPKCRKAYDNTAELRRRGFDAAEELAYVEVWCHGLYQYAFFVSEVAQGERLDAHVMTLRQAGNNEDCIRQLICEFAALVVRMHEHGVLYRDMNCGNVFCRETGNSNNTNLWHFTLIDTNRARFYSEDQPLSVDTAIVDLILMNPRMGTVELFQEEYLRQRNLYTVEEAQHIREVQRRRYERKNNWLKKFLKRYKQIYYNWLEK